MGYNCKTCSHWWHRTTGDVDAGWCHKNAPTMPNENGERWPHVYANGGCSQHSSSDSDIESTVAGLRTSIRALSHSVRVLSDLIKDAQNDRSRKADESVNPHRNGWTTGRVRRLSDSIILEHELSKRSYNCLLRAGHKTIDDVCGMTMADLKKVRRLGFVSRKEIVEFLAAHGRTLKET